MLVFILSHYIIFYYYILPICFQVRDRKGVDLEDAEELRVGKGEMLIRIYYVKIIYF